MSKNIRVFYHGNCRDGFTAAWAAWKKFGDNADYIPVVWTHLDPVIPDIKDKEIYFLDFVPTDEEFARVKKESRSMTVIDHHISREHLTRSLPGSVFDNLHSAAVLAWEYFHPDKEVPQLCLYVEDSDIWNWKIPNSQKVLIYVDLKGKFNFDVWDDLAKDLEDVDKRREYEEKGSLILEYDGRVVEAIIRDHAQLVRFEGYEVYAANAPRYFRSIIGNKLYEMKPPFGIVWNYTPAEISVSLRAKKGEFDLIPIASKYGGGGHKAAANFRLPLGSALPWETVNKNGKK